MEDYTPLTFIMNWALVALYLCSRYCIFDRFVLDEYVSQVERGPHLLQSYLRAAQNGLPLVTREILPSFESLTVTGALGLQVFLMDIHHDTSFRSMLEDGSISSASKTYICFCLSKGVGLWLIARPSIVHFALHILLSPQCCVFALV